MANQKDMNHLKSKYLEIFPSWSAEAKISQVLLPVSCTVRWPEIAGIISGASKSIFLLVYGANRCDVMPWQMTTDAEALLEISEASVMTAWVTGLIDPLPGRSQPASPMRGCYGISSAYAETYTFVFTVLLTKQFKDPIVWEIYAGEKGVTILLFIKTPKDICQSQWFLNFNLFIQITSVLVPKLSNLQQWSLLPCEDFFFPT